MSTRSEPDGITKLIANMEAAISFVAAINERLAELREEIREAQPVDHGAVLMELHNCGKGCSGCPHVVWKQWYNPKARRSIRHTNTWLASKVKRPVERLRRSKTYSAEARRAIEEAQRLTKVRREVLKRFAAVTLSVRNRAWPGGEAGGA